jgi:nitroreductase
MCGNPREGKYRADEPFYLFDCGLAVQSLVLEATQRGLVAHPFGGWDDNLVGGALGVPNDVRVVVLIAVGRPGSPDLLDETTRAKETRPHERKPLADLMYAEQWLHPLEGLEKADDAKG